MSRLNINIGTTANDRTGDPLRTAFEKVNANFIELYATASADVQIPSQATNGGKYLTTNGTTLSWGTVSTTVDQLVNGSNTVVLGSNGVLTLPNSGTITNSSIGSTFTATTQTGISGNTKEFTVGGDVDSLTTSWTATGGGIVGTAAITNVNVGLSATFVTFDQSFTATGPITFSSGSGATLELTPDGTTAWTFSSAGTLSSPNGSLQRNTGSINCQGNATTVVYTVSAQNQHTIKLLIQVEGIEGLGSIMDTQACEMIIAKSFRADDIAASVYGIVYTSVAPLATFTAEWNTLTNRVEVLCTTPGDNNVNVKIFATEISTSD